MTTDLIATFSDYATQLRERIAFHAASGFARKGETDNSFFNQAALDLFALQFAHNAPYRQFCMSRKVTPETVRGWREIPAVPTSAFKEWELTSIPEPERTHVFHSSGTTEQRPSRQFHHARSLAIYEASLLPWFAATVLPNGGRHDFIFLTPPPKAAPHSSLVHMFERIRRDYGSPASCFFGNIESDGAWNLDFAATLAALQNSILNSQPVVIMGTAFNFVHLLDHLQSVPARLRLPSDSRVMETGGYKGRSRILPKPELHALISADLGIPAANIICEYGMSELSSQAYDSTSKQTTDYTFCFPPWARAQIISPETDREVVDGETGLIRIFDLANVYSVLAIQTEDLGVRRGDGFELLGRATLSEPRGCSLQSI